MKFFLISGGGDGLGLGFRLRNEGHEVACWIRDRRSKQDYDGILLKKERWEDWIDDNTIIIFDSTGGGHTADRLRARGHFVLAGSSWADQLEMDRSVAFQTMRGVGIRTPHSETFFSWEDGKRYAKDHAERLCFKPSGSMSGIMSYLAFDSQDLVEMLDYFAQRATGEVEYELQDFVDGVEVSTEGWFNGREFMKPFNHTLERKQLMDDGLGPSGGCSGNVVWHISNPKEDRVLQEGIVLMEGILRYNNYIGPIDLNTIVNAEGVWGLEFTPRFGWDAFPAWLETLDQPLGDLLSQLAREEHPSHLNVKPEGFGAALRLTTPPYPSERYPADGDLPIRGFAQRDRPHLYFYNVRLNDKAQLVTTPAYGNTVALTGWGKTLSEAMDGPMALAQKAKIPNKQYRTDLTGLFLEQHFLLTQQLEEKVGGEAKTVPGLPTPLSSVGILDHPQEGDPDEDATDFE